ncbi:MAG: hypothetical protein ACUVT3_10485, partial [Ignavibacterium sp.]
MKSIYRNNTCGYAELFLHLILFCIFHLNKKQLTNGTAMKQIFFILISFICIYPQTKPDDVKS